MELKLRVKEVEREIVVRDEQIKKITSKLREKDAENMKKIVRLEDQVLTMSIQADKLKKFKEELERNQFVNEEEGFRVYVKTDEDLSGMDKKISMELGYLL